MPGSSDPANFSLPQQPMNKCLLPRTYQMPTLTLATNPHKFSLGGVEFLGNSGQPIENMTQYLNESRLQLIKNTLHWQHMAPTAPDTLSCVASKHDPLLITESPHVYFIGNQSEYSACLEKGADGQSTRILLLPDFSQTQTVVLLDLETLDTMPIKFSSFDV
jgi:DNA polymerase delta subunit 2